MTVCNPGHHAVGWHSVDVDVQHREEDRDFPSRIGGKAKFRRWDGRDDSDHATIGRGKEKADLRADLKEKTEKREADREMTRFNRRHA